MPEILDETSHIESTTVGVYRTSATVKGGRRFSFGALVIVGDRRGKVGFGYGKSNEVPSAVEKAQKYARRTMVTVPMAGRTVPHEVEGKFSASKVRLIPASPGTGVVAGGTVRAILEMAGVTDCLTKCYGSTNSANMVKAVFDGLVKLRQRQHVAKNRGIELPETDIEVKIERGRQFMPTASKEKMRGPVNTIGQDRKGRGGGGRRGPRGGGHGGHGGYGGQGGHGGQGGQSGGQGGGGGGESTGGEASGSR